MLPFEGSWIQRVREILRDWRDWLQPTTAVVALIAVGAPAIMYLAFTLNGSGDGASSLQTTDADGVAAAQPAIARAPQPAPAPERHAPDDVIGELDGKQVTVTQVKAIVKNQPEKAVNLRLNSSVSRSEATELLRKPPTVTQLPKPAPERPPVLTTLPTIPTTTTTRPPKNTTTTTTSQPKQTTTTTTTAPPTTTTTAPPDTTTTAPPTTTTEAPAEPVPPGLLAELQGLSLGGLGL